MNFALDRPSRQVCLACVALLYFGACRANVPSEQVVADATAAAVPVFPDPLTYEARGSEFQWSFAYAGADGDLGTPDDVSLGNTLLIPAGKQVELQLVSDDYIYILAAPVTGQREIAVPDMVHTLRFDSGVVNEYELISDPLCGYRFFHDEVMGNINVISDEQFLSQLVAAP